MKEFMFYIRNEKDAKKSLSEEQHLAFIEKCETYIDILKRGNKLVTAQPLIREGIVITKINSEWIEKNISDETGVQVGYYHIMANDMNEAIQLAKDNPEFEYVPSASIEVRPVKTKETETGYIYPVKSQ